MLNHLVIVDTFGVPATTQQALIYLMPVMMNKEPQIKKLLLEKKTTLAG